MRQFRRPAPPPLPLRGPALPQRSQQGADRVAQQGVSSANVSGAPQAGTGKGRSVPETLSVHQAGLLLQQHATTVRRLIQDGDLLAYRLSPRGRLLVVRDSVEQYLREEKAAHLFEQDERDEVRRKRRHRNDAIREQWRQEALLEI